MSNYIRACFCLAHRVGAPEFQQLLRELPADSEEPTAQRSWIVSGYVEAADGIPAVELAPLARHAESDIEQVSNWLASPGRLIVKSTWRIAGRPFQSRLLQAWSGPGDQRLLSFDVEESLFLPDRHIEYRPSVGDAVFGHYKQAITTVIRSLGPLLGVIDYEADLACPVVDDLSSAVGWGTFVSGRILDNWPIEDRVKLRQAVDEYVEFDFDGGLVFVHPLAANQAWTKGHHEVLALMERHWFRER